MPTSGLIVCIDEFVTLMCEEPGAVNKASLLQRIVDQKASVITQSHVDKMVQLVKDGGDRISN